MREKTKELIKFGLQKNIVELTEGGLIVESSIVKLQKINRANDPNNEKCMMLGQDLASKYSYPELLALSAKILKAESFMVLEFPDQDFNAFYFLYGDPEIINL
jgi:hypothetical protein